MIRVEEMEVGMIMHRQGWDRVWVWRVRVRWGGEKVWVGGDLVQS